jgi:tripartite-type tricarboxylate transporter receptor subunit TctC
MIGARLAGLVLAALCCAVLDPAVAQDAYPSKPVKLVVPLAAGGGIDFTARATAQKLSDLIGQQVVVENQGGAGGTIGVNAVVRAPPDGYTLLYHSVTGVVSAAVGKDLPYDWLRDLAPVSLVTRFAPVLIINPSLPANDLREFIALAKANPGKFSYGSSGPGTAIHLASELFKAAAGVDIVHVPYRGNAGVMPDLLAGRIAMLIDGVPAQTKNIESGVVRALAVTTRTRTAALPNVPTMVEQGLDYEVPYWTAIYAPAATPKPVIEKLAAEIARTMQDPGVVGRLKDAGTEAVGSTPQQLDAFNRDQLALYRRIVADPRLKLNLAIACFLCPSRNTHSAVQPPSSTSAEPVISDEASEARNTMAPVNSSSWPRRPSLILPSTSSRNALFSKNGRVIGVSRKVGPRLLTRMLWGASSIAIALVKPSMACLEAQ